MKTEVILHSEDRNLFGRIIPVSSKEGWISITHAMKAINAKREGLGLSAKRLEDIISTNAFNERVAVLCRESGRIRGISTFVNNFVEGKERVTSIQDLKKLSLARRKGNRADQAWYVDPYIFIMIALELDPEAYITVIKWVADGLVKKRNAAGDSYLRMSAALWKMLGEGCDFKKYISEIAKNINFVVLNHSSGSDRNLATEEDLAEFVRIQDFIAVMIELGVIKKFEEINVYLRKMYVNKWKKSNLINI